MLGELRGKLVKIVGQFNLSAKQPEGVRDRTPSRQCHQPRHRPAGALNDYLLTTLRQSDEP